MLGGGVRPLFDQIHKKAFHKKCTGYFFYFFFNNGEKSELFFKLRNLGLDLVCFYFLKYYKSSFIVKELKLKLLYFDPGL